MLQNSNNRQRFLLLFLLPFEWGVAMDGRQEGKEGRREGGASRGGGGGGGLLLHRDVVAAAATTIIMLFLFFMRRMFTNVIYHP